MGFTAELVARAACLDSIPSAVVDVAKASLLDTLAVAIAARGERVVEAVRGFVRDETGNGPSGIWGTSIRTSPTRAAFVNGAAAHALDFDDVCWAMNSHPSAVLWPVALAASELRGNGGRAALLGYVAGFEAAADLGALVGQSHYAAGFHPTSTIGTIGAAITAGKILGLDREALARATGIACSEAAGSRMNFGTDTKPLHAGLAAQAGFTAALLAARGVTARPDGIEAPMGFADLLGGARDPAAPTPSPPRVAFALIDPGVELKPYPSCRFTHRVIDATLELRARHVGREARSFECIVDPFSDQIVIYPRPTTGQEAKFSMQYCAAVAWLDGFPNLATFSDERAARRDVRELMARVNVRHGSAESETVAATFSDGSSDSETVRHAKGSPACPLTDVERLAKARACVEPLLGDRAVALFDAIAAFESLADMRAVAELAAP